MRINIKFVLAIIVTLNLTMSANALPWDNAPLACLPDRAERWDTINEMEPCHCPPQDKCLKFDDLKPRDLTFYIRVRHNLGDPGAWSGMRYLTIRGENIPNLNANMIMKMSFDQQVEALKGNITRVTGKSIVKRNGRYNVDALTINFVIENETYLRKLFDANSKYMPDYMQSVCCDSICPTSTIAQKVQQTVEYEVEIANPDYDADKAEEVRKQREEAAEEADDWVKSDSDGDEDGNEPPAEIEEYNVPEKITEKRIKTVDALQCIAAERAFLTRGREGCLIEGTPITMSDGSALKIEKLRVGDLLKSNKGEVKVTAINKFTQGEDSIYGINGGEAFFSEEHPVLTTSGWKSVNPDITSVKSNMGVVGKLSTGDKIVTVDGYIEVSTVDKADLADGVTVYNLSVEGGEGFFANGMMVKDFNQVQIHY